MLIRSGMALVAVVAGAIALGAVIGAAANPVMKMPPQQSWQGALQAPVAAEAGYLMIEAPPQDLSPYRDSYAPSWAHEERADWEPAYPAWTYSDLADERFANSSAADGPRLAEQQVSPATEVTAPAATTPEPVEPVALAAEPEALDAAAGVPLATRVDDLY